MPFNREAGAMTKWESYVLKLNTENTYNLAH